VKLSGIIIVDQHLVSRSPLSEDAKEDVNQHLVTYPLDDDDSSSDEITITLHKDPDPIQVEQHDDSSSDDEALHSMFSEESDTDTQASEDRSDGHISDATTIDDHIYNLPLLCV
jgi:hypothetical protein